MVQITIRGDKEIANFFGKLPKKLLKELDKTNGLFLKKVQKSAKLRAPRMSGDLAASITHRKTANGWRVYVSSPYGRYQEIGFRPHLIHSSMSTKNSLGTVGDALMTNEQGFAMVRKHTPFLFPAFNAVLPGFDEMLSKATDRVLRTPL